MKIGIVINNVIRDYIGKTSEVYEKYTGNKPILPINPYQLEQSFPLHNEEFVDIYQWIYYGACLEIFGSANQTQTNLLARICNFQTKIEDKLIILSKETNRSKIATLSFLSKNQFDLSEIIFVDGYEDYWNYADAIITDNPEIIRAKPLAKIAVVLKNDFNTEFHNEQYTIDSPEGIFTLPFLQMKPVKPEELIHVTGEMMEEEDVVMDNPEELVVEGAQPVKVEDAKVEFVNGVPVLNLSEISGDDRGVPPDPLHD